MAGMGLDYFLVNSLRDIRAGPREGLGPGSGRMARQQLGSPKISPVAVRSPALNFIFGTGECRGHERLAPRGLPTRVSKISPLSKPLPVLNKKLINFIDL